MEIANGQAHLACESTRGSVKPNVEFPAAWLLIHESGGSVLTLNEVDLAEQNFLEFGTNLFIPLIAGCNKKFIKQAINFFKRHND